MTRVLKTKHRAVSQGDDWLEARRPEHQEATKAEKVLLQASHSSIFGHKTHLQEPHNAGSRPEMAFFHSPLSCGRKTVEVELAVAQA
jgi:hypothetical protein